MQRLIERGALFDAGPDGCSRTREGGHPPTGSSTPAVTPPVPRSNAPCWLVLRAARGAGRALRRWTSVLDGSGRASRVPCWTRRTAGRADPQRRRRAGHRRRRAPVRGHHEPGGRDRRRPGMALRAGAALADVEFMQFHPTVLWTGPGDLGHRPLVTEAVRGEGAVLIDGGRRPDHAPACIRWPTWRRGMWCRWRCPGEWRRRRAASPTTSSWMPQGLHPRFRLADSRPSPRPAALAGVNPTTETDSGRPGRALPLRRVTCDSQRPARRGARGEWWPIPAGKRCWGSWPMPSALLGVPDGGCPGQRAGGQADLSAAGGPYLVTSRRPTARVAATTNWSVRHGDPLDPPFDELGP